MQGTKRKLTVHYTLQQNSVAECTHKTIFRGVQVCLTFTKLLLILWAEVAIHIMYIYNRTLCTVLNYNTPHNKHYKNYRTIDNIYEFSQYVIIQNENTTKLQQ